VRPVLSFERMTEFEWMFDGGTKVMRVRGMTTAEAVVRVL